MAEKSSDPAAAWRNMLGDWEKNFNSFANKAMEKEDFSKAMGAATGAATTAQGVLGDVMQRYLSTLNLPSRQEIATIGERLVAMEAQLTHLTRLVQSIPGVVDETATSAPKPARTRQPPSAAKPAEAETKPAEPAAKPTESIERPAERPANSGDLL